MKSTILFAFFLLSAFISHLPSATLAFVLDTDGEPLRNGGTYYILPAIWARGGGIGRTATGNETCPLTVVQLPSELDNGLPIRISSPYKIAYIYEGLPLDLAFTFVPLCSPTPSKWTIIEELPEPGLPSVKLTGYDNTVSGWFKIEKSVVNSHELTFCALSNGSCLNIGIYLC